MNLLNKIQLKIENLIAKEAISDLSKEIRNKNLTYLSEIKIRNIEDCLKNIKRNNTLGIFVETGIALGGSSIIISKLMPKGSIFHGYDVFEMIPKPSSVKDDQKSRDRFDTIKKGESKGIGGNQYYGYEDNLYEKVVSSFKNFDLQVDNQKICLHKGLFEDTLIFSPSTKIAFAHVDCDWYEPVSLCLNRIYSNLSQAGYIVIDDYNDYGGCKTATDEFLSTHPDIKVVKNQGNLVLQKK